MWKNDSRPVALNVFAVVLLIAAEDGLAPARQCLTAWSISISVSQLNEKKDNLPLMYLLYYSYLSPSEMREEKKGGWQQPGVLNINVVSHI